MVLMEFTEVLKRFLQPMKVCKTSINDEEQTGTRRI